MNIDDIPFEIFVIRHITVIFPAENVIKTSFALLCIHCATWYPTWVYKIFNKSLLRRRTSLFRMYHNNNKKLIALRFPRICLIYSPKNLKRLSEIT